MNSISSSEHLGFDPRALVARNLGKLITQSVSVPPSNPPRRINAEQRAQHKEYMQKWRAEHYEECMAKLRAKRAANVMAGLRADGKKRVRMMKNRGGI